MCILIQQPKGHTFSNFWLKDFFAHNADGIGVMYSDQGKLVVKKALPQTVEELIKFYRENIQGRECFIHLRMRTHGDINLEQCHPYEIFGEDTDYPLYLMHNGVLTSGNAADQTKSDTWHYINNIIRPALQADPTQFTSKWFKTLIEDNIGYSNKFAILDKHGNSAIFNKGSGVMWGDIWMSNTYAWDAKAAGVAKPVSYYGSSFPGYGYGGYDAYDDYPAQRKKTTAGAPAQTTTPAAVASTWDLVDMNEYVDELRRALRMKNMFRANGVITTENIRDLWKYFGYKDAYVLVDSIIDCAVDEEDVIYFFEKFQQDPINTYIENIFDLYSPSGYEEAMGVEAADTNAIAILDENESAVIAERMEAHGLFD